MIPYRFQLYKYDLDDILVLGLMGKRWLDVIVEQKGIIVFKDEGNW